MVVVVCADGEAEDERAGEAADDEFLDNNDRSLHLATAQMFGRSPHALSSKM